MRIVALLWRWISRSRVRPAEPAAPQPTLIDRRIWALGYIPNDSDRIASARRLEVGLAEAASALQWVEPDGSRVSQNAVRCRTRIQEFADKKEGSLARAVQRWPSRDSRDLDRVLRSGEELLIQGREALKMVETLTAMRRKARELETDYAESVPELWETYAGGTGLEDQLNRCQSPARLHELGAYIEEAQQTLSDYYARLAALEVELSQICAGTGSGDHSETQNPDIEARVRQLVDRVNDLSHPIRTRAIRSIDGSCNLHLVHLGRRVPQRGVQGKLIGSVDRSLARWRQLEGTHVGD